MKRFLSLLLVLVMLLGTLMLVGCPAPDNGDDPNKKDPSGTGEGEWADTLDTATIRKELGGEKLVITCRENFEYEIYAEESSKDALEQMVYKRNKKIEERFGVTIEPLVTKLTGDQDHLTHLNYVQTQINTMNPEFHLIMMMAYQSGKLIMGGNYRDWRSAIPYARDDIKNADSKWWPAEMNTSATVNGRQFVALSDMCITAIDLSYGMVFNDTLMRNENVISKFNELKGTNYTSIYDVVNAGDWTLDNMIDMTKDFWLDNEADPNGSGSVDEGDVIGMWGGTSTDVDAFAYSLGFTYIVNDGVSDPTIWNIPVTFGTAVEKLYSYFHESRGATMAGQGKGKAFETSGKVENRNKFFAEGHALFKSASLKDVMSKEIKAMDDDYGIIPYPKYSKSQANYQTGISDNVTVLSVSKYTTGKNLRLAGAITVALSAETNKSINATYYEMIVKHDSGFIDKRSVEMVDKIVQGRVYDLGFYHHKELTWDESKDNACFAIFMRYLLWTGDDVSGTWQAMGDVAANSLRSIVKGYQSIK